MIFTKQRLRSTRIGLTVGLIASLGLLVYLMHWMQSGVLFGDVWRHPLLFVLWTIVVPAPAACFAWLVGLWGYRFGDALPRRMISRWLWTPTATIYLLTFVWLLFLFHSGTYSAVPHGVRVWLWLRTYGMVLPLAAGLLMALSFLLPSYASHEMVTGARALKERAIFVGLLMCALVSVLTTAGIIYVLTSNSLKFFAQEPVWRFLTGTEWTAGFQAQKFGVLPLLCGTMLVAGGALLIAVPVGLAAAIFLSEYAPAWLRGMLKPALEILAGIPTVVYGFFALHFITPTVLRPLFGESNVGPFNALSAIIVVAIMIVPTISSLCDDAFRAVPKSLREAAYALSATRMEVSFRVVLPGALSGVMASILLALARAIGETMAVTMAAGARPNLTLNPLENIQTMTSFIVNISLGDTELGSKLYYSLYAVGLTLFAITLVINLIATRIMQRYREAYE